jgi:hypothetical protein
MSSREKKLLMLFLVAGFVMLNFLGGSYYLAKKGEVALMQEQAKRALNTAELFRASRGQAEKEMEWLVQNEPKPAENQDVQVALESYCTVEAGKCKLTIGKLNLQTSDTTGGNHFHRAKIVIEVTGSEASLYEWLDRINVPDKLRRATRLVLSPNPQDDTKIDCKATIEQWFVPATQSP